MNEGEKLLLSATAASFIAPTLFAIYFSVQSYYLTSSMFVTAFASAWIVAVFHLLLLGLPIFVFLKRTNMGWYRVAGAGFIAGIIPVGILTSPVLSVGSLDGETWLTYAMACLPCALSGVASSAVLWCTWVFLGARKRVFVFDRSK